MIRRRKVETGWETPEGQDPERYASRTITVEDPCYDSTEFLFEVFIHPEDECPAYRVTQRHWHQAEGELLLMSDGFDTMRDAKNAADRLWEDGI
jgi:hypothetical protein